MSTKRFLGLLHCLVLGLVLVSLVAMAIPASSVKAASVVTFPDANLEAAIRDAIGQPTGDIYDDNLTSLVTLDASGLGIVDLTGLEYCTNLTYLNLYSNQTDNLTPLSGLTSLTYLELGSNQIGDISPLSGLASLTNLGLSSNQISDISPLSGLTSLTSLLLNGNQADNLTPLSSLTSLTSLGLESNEIGDISPLTDMTSLTSLTLYNNQVSDISPLSGLTGLTTLLLSHNQADNITPLAGLTSLTYLYLADDQISDISPLAGLTELTSLDLSSNQIGNIEPLVNNPGMGSGDSLYLYSNPLSNSSIDVYVPTLEGRGVTVYWDAPTNQSPDQPSNLHPTDAESNVSLTLTLQSSTFSDPDDADTHAASQWQITTVSDNYTSAVYDSLTDNVNLTSIVVPVATLSYSTTYYWHVRYQDNRGAWSAWSAETGFNTLTLAPLVTTSSATSLTTYSAQLNGFLTSLGAADNVTVSFVWGTSSGSLPNETTGQVMTGEWSFYFDLGSLTPGITYYYQAKAVGDGTSYGAENSFSTLPPTPLVTTGGASSITANSARLNGSLTSLGTASSVTVSFVWGTSSGSLTNETTGQAMTSAGAFYFDFDNLTPGTTIYYMSKAAGDGISYGVETRFTTTAIPSVVATNDATSVTIDSARLNGDLTSLGTTGSVTVSFVWGTSSGSLINETTTQAMTGTGTFYFDLGSLGPGTTYYYKAKAVGHGGPVYGAAKSFATGRSPEVESLDPVEGKRKQDLTVTITGANLDGATGVSFGSGITVDDFSVVSSSEITAEITIDAKAAKGTRDVSVTTAWGTATKTDGFSVIGGGGGICSGGALATPGAPSEMTTTLAALGVLLGVGYLLVRRGTRSRRDSVRT